METSIQSILIVFLKYTSIVLLIIGFIAPVISGIRGYYARRNLEPSFYAYKLLFLFLFLAVVSFSLYTFALHPEDFLTAMAMSGCLIGIWLFFVATSLIKFERVYGKGAIKRLLRSNNKDKG